MATTLEVREPTAAFDLIVSDDLPLLSVDGVSQALLGFPNSRLVFHVVTSVAAGGKVEQRKAIVSLHINTLALAQICQQTYGALVQGRDNVLGAAEEFKKQLSLLLEPPMSIAELPERTK
jgi:hypothetical protein